MFLYVVFYPDMEDGLVGGKPGDSGCALYQVIRAESREEAVLLVAERHNVPSIKTMWVIEYAKLGRLVTKKVIWK